MASNRKIAFIDLNDNSVTVKDIPKTVTDRYLGGPGHRHVPPVQFARNRNRSPFARKRASHKRGITDRNTGTGRGEIPYRRKISPDGLVGSANMGGFFGPELRFAGFDHLVVRGKAKKPVYLLVKNGNIEIRDASGVWGKDCTEAQTHIRDELGDPDIKVLTIGVAGENLVRFANVRTGVKNTGGAPAWVQSWDRRT